jgi:hypothetical protein
MSARQLFSTMAASSTITRSTARRCTMRSLGLLAFLTLLASTALFAQHATTMPSPPAVHTTVTTPHTTVKMPAIHTGVAAPHVSAPHGIASTSHPVAQTPHIATVKTNEARISGAKPNPEKHGLFSWFRKREPIGSDSHKQRKERRNPNPNYLAQQVPPRQVPPSTALANRGCTIVPASNPGIPCNPLAPCCP